MTTQTDFIHGNFNSDFLAGTSGSEGDLFLFDNFGNKAIWLEDGNGGRLAALPNGINLAFTGPTWHIAAIADFDSPAVRSIITTGNDPRKSPPEAWVKD
jgi:hypothetical protein